MAYRAQSVFSHLCGGNFTDVQISMTVDYLKISVLVKSKFTVALRSFLSLWSISVIHTEHLKKPGGTLGLGRLGTDEAF